jgi:hypothetical protein
MQGKRKDNCVKCVAAQYSNMFTLQQLYAALVVLSAALYKATQHKLHNSATDL